MNKELINYQVEKAGYYFKGYCKTGVLRLNFYNCALEISCASKEIIKLFEIFGVDTENGVFFEELKGKYCRIYFEDEKMIALQHIIKDNIYVIDNETNKKEKIK